MRIVNDLKRAETIQDRAEKETAIRNSFFSQQDEL